MTESEWLIANEPEEMLGWLRGKVSGRRSRLFCVACARHIWPLLAHESGRRAVDVAERFAEGGANVAELAGAWQAAEAVARSQSTGPSHAALAASYAAWPGIHPLTAVAGRYTWDEAAARSAHAAAGDVYWHTKAAGGDVGAIVALAKDCFGNSVRGLTAEPVWLTTDVISLARLVYEGQAYDLMPIMADALQDAGCDNVNILDHCRGPGPHVRGCWVVDLVFGRE